MRKLLTYFIGLAGALLLLTIQPVLAFEIPPAGSVAFIQTSGSNAGINIGDYYTSAAADNTFHEVQLYIPCTWNPTLTVTIALFDPESSQGATVVDETRDAGGNISALDADADDTSFTLTAPGGAVVGSILFTTAATNELWVELATVDITNPAFGCGRYTITTTTSDNDDNAWRFKANHDPDCGVSPGACSAIGAASSTLLDNGNEFDDADTVAGSGDELFTSFTRLSLQHNAQGCVTFFFFVDGTQPNIRLNNFDMDDNGSPDISITYNPPAGSQYVGPIAGTESLRSSWNGSPSNPGNNPNPPRTGDVFAIAAQDVGWWNAELCVQVNNQYIFEGQEGEPVFFEQPPFPIVTLAKDNGVTQVSGDGAQVTYTINYANTNPVGAPTFGGAALSTTIVDTLPAGATFVSCTGGCVHNAVANTATWNIGTVPAPPIVGNSGSVTVTVNLPAAPAGSTHTNSASIDFTDIVGFDYQAIVATDIDNVIGGTGGGAGAGGGNGGANDATAQTVSNADGNLTIRKSVLPPFAQAGDAVAYSIVVTNIGTTALSGISVTDTVPSDLSVTGASTSNGTATVNGQQVTLNNATLNAGESLTLTVNATISTTVAIPFVLVNQACITGTTQCAQASVLSVSALPQTGESPYSGWRYLVFGMMFSLMISAGYSAYNRGLPTVSDG